MVIEMRMRMEGCTWEDGMKTCVVLCVPLPTSTVELGSSSTVEAAVGSTTLLQGIFNSILLLEVSLGRCFIILEDSSRAGFPTVVTTVDPSFSVLERAGG